MNSSLQCQIIRKSTLILLLHSVLGEEVFGMMMETQDIKFLKVVFIENDSACSDDCSLSQMTNQVNTWV